MVIIAHGRLQHHFWGTYAASIVIRFATEALATAAAPQFPDFKQHEQKLGFHGSEAALQSALASLYAHGADRKKVESLAHSIDYGDPFTVEVDLTPAPTETQLPLLEV